MIRTSNPDFTVSILPDGYRITADLISNPSQALAELAKLSYKYDPERDMISDTFDVPELDRIEILAQITIFQDQLLILFEKFQLFQRFSEIQSKLARPKR